MEPLDYVQEGRWESSQSSEAYSPTREDPEIPQEKGSGPIRGYPSSPCSRSQKHRGRTRDMILYIQPC
jgi:hypothetical protein